MAVRRCRCGAGLNDGFCEMCGEVQSLCRCASVAEVVPISTKTKVMNKTVAAPVSDAGSFATGTNDDLIVPSPNNPMAVARQFVATHYTDTENLILVRHHRGAFHLYDGRCWPEGEDRSIRAALYRWLEPAKYWKSTTAGLELADFEPNRKKLGDLVEAIAAIGHVGQSTAPPAWLEPTIDVTASDIVVMQNGLLHLPTRTLLPHTPRLFAQHALPFEFDPRATTPKRWLAFLRELWQDDDESIGTLGEIFGYILSGSTVQQKLFMLIGPKRSGKGTTGRVLTGLLGAHNVAAPTLAGLTTNFGLSPLIGRPLGLISDARLSTRADGLIAVERLLSISGEDSITIDRKYREPWTGRLPTRFVVLTNEIPRFTDSSGALASRFVMLITSTSFYGREDVTLTDTLLGEATGIFNWALDGLDRLNARGYFQLPSSSAEALKQLEDLSSPVGAFVRERCEVGPVHEVSKDVLYEDWKHWCESEGKDRMSTKEVFLRDLRAAVPGIRVVRTREGEARHRILQGIDLRRSTS